MGEKQRRPQIYVTENGGCGFWILSKNNQKEKNEQLDTKQHVNETNIWKNVRRGKRVKIVPKFQAEQAIDICGGANWLYVVSGFL